MNALTWIAVLVLAGLGACLRFVVDAAVSARAGRGIPLGTLVVNVTGAVALGVVSGLALRGDAALLTGTAAVGSYTTFSTWALDTERLAGQGRVAAATANVLVSVALGLAAVALGRTLGGAL